jgi:hypothetical protein
MEPGAMVRMVFTKWGDLPHWEIEATYLGSDEHGDWLGVPAGTHIARPGNSYDTRWGVVTLVPSAPFVARFMADGRTGPWTYVDITTLPVWSENRLTCVDLDLDVIDPNDERGIFIADEDEFAEHQVTLGYPPEVIAMARESADAVLEAVRSGEAPFDGSHLRWPESSHDAT